MLHLADRTYVHFHDAHGFATYWPRFVEAFGGRAFDHGTAHGLEDCLALALWLPPGVEPDAETVMALSRDSLSDQTFADVGALFEQMDELHPSEDHWYLPLTGVDPPAQGRRLGSRLLEHALAICDADRLPAYLEATKQDTVPYYMRFGFEVTGEIKLPDGGPSTWPMWRAPR